MPKVLQGEKAPRLTLSLRVTPSIKQRLEGDARRSGKALALEAEERIERSFEQDRLLGGSDTASMLLAMHEVQEKVRRVAAARKLPAAARKIEELAAINLLAQAFINPDTEWPVDAVDMDPANWQEGDIGRRAAFDFLWWSTGEASPRTSSRSLADIMSEISDRDRTVGVPQEDNDG